LKIIGELKMKSKKVSTVLAVLLLCASVGVLANIGLASATDATVTFYSTVNGFSYDWMRFYVDYGSAQYTTATNLLQAGTHHIYCEALFGYVTCGFIQQYRSGSLYATYTGNTADINLQDGDYLIFVCHT
jgi:hypothetical protein